MPASSWIDAFLHLAHFATVQRPEHERRALSHKRSARRRRQFRDVLGNAQYIRIAYEFDTQFGMYIQGDLTETSGRVLPDTQKVWGESFGWRER